MSPVFSTPAGATVTYISSTWPWSLHASSRNMTFWNDLLSALAQFTLFSSSTAAPSTIPEVGHFVSPTSATQASSTAPLSQSTIAFHQALKSHGNAGDNLKQSINQTREQYSDLISRRIVTSSDFSGGNVSAAMLNGDVKMLNMTNVSSPLIMNETLLIGARNLNNFTTDSVLNSLVDCNDFTEQKLLNIVICSISDVNSNLINGSIAVENSTFNETLRNISDDLISLYNSNNSYFFNDTEVSGNNTTGNTSSQFESTIYFIQVITTAVVLGIIILATVIGNVFVIAAILLEKNLQSVANYLILSLAVADLLVACLVMPLSAVYEISREWKLGPELCDMWTSSDVLCCTASILHLVAIALDRYWAVTEINYAHQRTGKRIGIMIVILWILSFLVSIAPMLGWKDPEWDKRLENYECLVSQDIGYQIFATASSFYVPLLAILFLYWRIFLVARKRIRRRQQANVQTRDKPLRKANASKCNIPLTSTFGIRWKVSYGQQQQLQQKKQMPVMPGGCIAQAAGGSGTIAAAVVAVIGRPLPTISEATTTTTTTAFTNVSSANTSPEKCSYANGLDDRIEIDPPTSDNISVAYPSNISCPPHPIPASWKKLPQGPPVSSKENKSILKKKTPTANEMSSKRERKAAKTLAIITGAFVVCWMPFFVIAVLLPICADECAISPIIISLFLWLGYFNSTLNPILYTIFNQDFRNAFKRLLCGRRNSVRRRNRRMGLRETR